MKQPIFAGVDVGGTNTKIGIITEDGTVISSGKFPTGPNLAPSHCLDNANQMIRELIQDSGLQYTDLAAVGLATPGPMDIPNGIVLTPFNLPGWRNTDVREILSNSTQRQVAFANDAGAAAYGEFWVGSGRHFDSIVLITLGTGVGGGIIIDGFSIDGFHSHGSEIGHMIVDTKDDARRCSCGGAGHLEAYASATGLVARCSDALTAGATSSLREMISDASPLSALMIFQAAEQGDQFAHEQVMETASYLAEGIVSLIHIIDPQAILLGGAMDFGGMESQTGRAFVQQIYDRARPKCLPMLADKLTIEFANLGSDAGFIGAAGLARKMHFSQTTTPTV